MDKNLEDFEKALFEQHPIFKEGIRCKWYEGAWWAWQEQQKQIDELQAKYDELNNRATSIALDQMKTAQLNYQLEQKISELQARVDRAINLIERWKAITFEATSHWREGYEEGCYNCAADLEQALKGGER